MTETMNFTQEWDKTFKLSEEAEHKKVTFTNLKVRLEHYQLAQCLVHLER